MNRDMIVAIDGPRARERARSRSRLRGGSASFISTPGRCTALTWLAWRDGVDEDGAVLARLARANPVSFDSEGRVEIAGEDVSSAIREAEIDRLVSGVARHPEVREVMREAAAAGHRRRCGDRRARHRVGRRAWGRGEGLPRRG